MKKSVVTNANWAGNTGKAVVSLANGDTVWLSATQLENFGVSVPQAMTGGELTYEFHKVGETLSNGAICDKADSLVNVRTVTFDHEELRVQAYEMNAKISADLARERLTEAKDARAAARAALAKRLKGAMEGNGSNPPAGASNPGADPKTFTLDNQAGADGN